MPDQKKTSASILPTKNGPYLVKGTVRLVNSQGDIVEANETFALCRCGGSRTKPFCDGTHMSNGFTDKKEEDRIRDQQDNYEGKEVEIIDNRGICSHAAFCTSGLPSVWRSSVEPWIDPDGAPQQDILNTIHKCPSGALSYRLSGKIHNQFHDTPEIFISRDGPYYVRGFIELQDTEFLEGASPEHFTLCRCGKSKNKPFCDGTHWYADFRDDEGLTISRARRAEVEKTREEWTSVGAVEDFTEDKIHSVNVGNKEIALVRTGDKFHALTARCPHQGGPLAEGTLCEGAIRCPWHGHDFSVETGKGVGNDFQAEKLEVRVTDGNVEVAAPASKKSGWTVSHVIAETMTEWGIDTVFGMVGHSNLGMAEAIRVQEERGKLRFFGIRHEGAASFAASGYAKVTGRPAACLSIAGPGATNLLTGLWDAKVDRAPILALTGQVQTQVLGPGAFQEIELASAFDAVSAFSQTVLHDSNHAELAALALKNAIVQRDVAHLILPDEVQTIDAGEMGASRPQGRISATAITPPVESVDLAMYRINRARRPAIIVGYGARDAMPEVIGLAEKLNCPVITTFKAKGQISDYHPLGACVLGKSGTPITSWFTAAADLLIVFGASFSNHTGIARDKPIIQVDFDRMALGKFHPVSEPVWGDIATTASIFSEKLRESSKRIDQRDELKSHKMSWMREKVRRAKVDTGNGINSAAIFQQLTELMPENAIIAVDVGNNTYSFGRYFECREQSILMSGYLGSIGFGFPAAMGAWAARTGRPVYSVSGDGGFGQYMTEFQTAVKYGMKITHILLNNNELGKISKEQRDGEWEVWQTSLTNINFAEYATLTGGLGIRVEKIEDLASAMTQADDYDGPALIEIMSDPLLT
jgi:pyruvate oxidase